MTARNFQIPDRIENEEEASQEQKDRIRDLTQKLEKLGASGFPENSLRELGKLQAASLIDQLESELRSQDLQDATNAFIESLGIRSDKAKYIFVQAIIAVVMFLSFCWAYVLN